MKSLSEEEKYILALVEMDLDKLNDLGGENIMDEYVKEAEGVSFEGFSQGKVEIAKNMLKDNIPVESISKYISLLIDEIKNLK